MSFLNHETSAADVASRLPPGQRLTRKWPVLHYGSVPNVDLSAWDFRIWGLVEEPVAMSWGQFEALRRAARRNDIHCVTGWSRLDNTWEGVAVHDVLALSRPTPKASHALVHAEHGFTANLALAELDRPENLFAVKHDGKELEPDHGWPLRLVVPHLYFWKSVKWVRGIEIMDHEQAGFWEQNGYHMHGDPWTEERYSSWW
jgi:DMSO/TMAO reductase YedYZ molybdopterin-dependent catalytic subunit